MPHVFKIDHGAWAAHPLTGGPFALRGTDARDTGASLRSAGAGGYYLLAPASAAALVNGRPVLLGISALKDKDELAVPGETPMYFSMEQRVQVEAYAGEPGGTCLRCASSIEAGSPAVQCPGCQKWYHQRPDRLCFSYGDHPICVECGADAVVSDEFRWVPEEL